MEDELFEWNVTRHDTGETQKLVVNDFIRGRLTYFTEKDVRERCFDYGRALGTMITYERIEGDAVD